MADVHPLTEAVARAMWEKRRDIAKAWLPDDTQLEEWGDGSIPVSNGIMDEANEAIREVLTFEPTMDMAHAGAHWPIPIEIYLASRDDANKAKAIGRYRAMTATLLKEVEGD